MPIQTTIEFETVVEEYSRLIFSICYSMTNDYFEAEDLAQETFLSACKNFSSFHGDNIKPWLTTIAANKCRDYLKSAARRGAARLRKTVSWRRLAQPLRRKPKCWNEI